MNREKFKAFLSDLACGDYERVNFHYRMELTGPNGDWFEFGPVKETSFRANYSFGGEEGTLVCEIEGEATRKKISIFIRSLDLRFTLTESEEAVRISIAA